MKIEQHDIDHEFPAYHEKLDQLRKADSEFDALVDRHDLLDRDIHKIEERQQPVSDTEMEKMKFERASLKDQIWQRLRNA